ncbi:MAG: hypothetical protein HPY69_03885 [Armatimonadetes bacterium]|nr:hypothetical protein [Armatimonadota bacterium]
MLRHAVVGATLLGLLSPVLAGTTAEEVELSQSLQTQVVTPHKDWGAGWVKGPVRALFLIYSGTYGGSWDQPGTRLREVIELMQRFDITGDAAYFGSNPTGDQWNFHGLKLGEDRVERLLQKPYDLYVIGGFPMEKLPAKVQYEIMKPVAEGAGLLCCGNAPNEYMAEKRQLSPLPGFITGGLPWVDPGPLTHSTTAYKLGKGRGVWLKYDAHGLTPRNYFSFRGLAEYDYRMLLVGRAALWAAGRDNDIELVSVAGPEPVTVQRDSLPATTELIMNNRRTAPVPVTVELGLRRGSDGYVWKVPKVTATLAGGAETRLSVSLPRVRAGDYYLDVVAKSDRGTEAFGAGKIIVASPFGVDRVTMYGDYVERGKTLGGEIVLYGEVPTEAALVLRFRDSYGRVLRQQRLPLVDGQNLYRFSFSPDEFSTILMRAEAVLTHAGAEVEMKDASFTVPKRRHGEFNFVQWDTPQDVLGYWAWRQLREAGQEVCLIGSMGNEPTRQVEVLKAWDISLVPYSTRILDKQDENGYMLPTCWNHEPDVTAHVQKIVDNQQLLRQQGVFVYSLGDEGVTRGCCVHPDCLATYRRWLQEQYGTIERLNESWGEAYASFDEVNLLDPKDYMENAAASTCPPRWYDRQAFARWNLSNYVARYVRAYSELDPQALTGYEGTGGFGDDYDAIMTTNTFYGPYPDLGDDILRSCYPRDRVRSNWMGYSKTGDALSDAAWRMVMKGMDSIWYWMWDGLGDYWGYLKPSLDYYPATADVAREMTPVRHGLGDLILKAQPVHSGIAVFYSLPSAINQSIENGRDFVSPQQTHETWTQLTYELGLDFRYLTSKLLTGGALTNEEFRVLLLPHTSALSRAEAEAIRRFAEGGGTVIADVRPGIFDEHCKAVNPGLLDDLFGIVYIGRSKGAVADVTVAAEVGGKTLSGSFPKTHVDTQVRTAESPTADSPPALIVRRVGQGRAILLNFQLSRAGKDDPITTASRGLLRGLYELAGARSPAKVTAPDGGPLPVTEARQWRTGNGLLLGIWRRMENAWFNPSGGVIAGPPQPARVSFDGKRHVYDLRAGKYLGQVSRVETQLRWGRASFFLALPYQITGLQASLSTARPQRGEVVTATVRLRGSGKITERLPVWVEITDPAGNRPLWGRQTMLLTGGAGQIRLPVAHNDTPGKWRLRATELFSGKSAEVAWTVQ